MLDLPSIEFIRQHLNDDVNALALKSFSSGLDKMLILNQIAARQILAKKVPLLAENDEILFPQHLSLEQSSSQITAEFKRKVISSLFDGEKKGLFADLTGGLGVDCLFLSNNFSHTFYVENQASLCDLARNNFSVLKKNIDVVNDSSFDFLKATSLQFDLLFIDPARRDAAGHKLVSLHDCSPDVAAHLDLMFAKSSVILLKASPMLDIDTALRELKNVSNVYVVAVKNECKELLFLMKKGFTGEPLLTCVDLAVPEQSFSFFQHEERECRLILAEEQGKYLYEPNVALLKSGCFKLLAERYGLKKLGKNSHFYFSDERKDGFLGKIFEVKEVLTFDKMSCKKVSQEIGRCNVVARNFPLTADMIRKKMKLRDGGDDFLFATEWGSKKVMILGRR